jgi:hypothetical protein
MLTIGEANNVVEGGPTDDGILAWTNLFIRRQERLELEKTTQFDYFMAMGGHPAKSPQETRLKLTEFDKRVKSCEEVGLTPDHDMKGAIVRNILNPGTRNTL